MDVSRLAQVVEEASRHFNMPLSIPAVLMKVVGQALGEHRHLVRRVVRRRVHDFKQVNALLAFHNQHHDEADLMYLWEIDEAPLPKIAQRILSETLAAARGEDRKTKNRRNLERFGPLLGPVARWTWRLGNAFHLPENMGRVARLQTAAVMVNYLGFAGAPPLRSFKAGLMRSNSVCVHVALGASEDRAVVEDGEVVVKQLAPLIVRIDHRIADAVQLGRFVQTLGDYLADPWMLGCLDAAESG